jgi:hypothetical protein
MTWVGTKKIIIKILTLETGDMPQKVFFGAFWTHWRQVTGPPCQKSLESMIKSCTMGSCIKVVKYFFFWFPTEKKSF